jgi:hypothetical protein
MKLKAWYPLAIVPVGLFFVSDGVGAQLAIRGVTLGIFFGTLSFGGAAGLQGPAGDRTSTNPGH